MKEEDKIKAYDSVWEKAAAAYGSGAYDDETIMFLFPDLLKDEEYDKKMIRIITSLLTGARDAQSSISRRWDEYDGALEWFEKNIKASVCTEDSQPENTSATNQDDAIRKEIIGYLTMVRDGDKKVSVLNPLIDNWIRYLVRLWFIPGNIKGLKCNGKNVPLVNNQVDISTKADEIQPFKACLLRFLQSAANRNDDEEILADVDKYSHELIDLAKKFLEAQGYDICRQSERFNEERIMYDRGVIDGKKMEREKLPTWVKSNDKTDGTKLVNRYVHPMNSTGSGASYCAIVRNGYEMIVDELDKLPKK